MQANLKEAGDIGYQQELTLHLATLVEMWGSPEFRERLVESVAPGLGTTNARVLWELGFRHRSRPSTLARIIGVGAPSITKAANGLRSRGLIELTADDSDARAILLSLTPKGRELTRQLYQAGDDVISELTDGWTDSDLRVLTALLGRLTSRAQLLAAGDDSTPT